MPPKRSVISIFILIIFIDKIFLTKYDFKWLIIFLNFKLIFNDILFLVPGNGYLLKISLLINNKISKKLRLASISLTPADFYF